MDLTKNSKNFMQETQNYPYIAKKKIHPKTDSKNIFFKANIENINKIIKKINDFLKALKYNFLEKKDEEAIKKFILENINARFGSIILIKKNNYKEKPYREKIFLRHINNDTNQRFAFFTIYIERFFEPRDLSKIAKQFNVFFDYKRHKMFSPAVNYNMIYFRIKY